MKRLFGLAALIASLALSVAAAEMVPWRVVQAPDGAIYMIRDGMKQQIHPEQVSFEELALVADGPAWSGGEVAWVSGKGISNSQPFYLDQGTYRVAWEAKCGKNSFKHFSGSLAKTEGRFFGGGFFASQSIDGEIGSGESYYYGIVPGVYYVDMNTSCEWQVWFFQM